MLSKLTQSIGVCLVLIAAIPSVQAAEIGTRNPELGDPGPKPTHMHRVKQTSARAARIARSDKQGPGTENGNQPDRAMSGE